MDYCLWIELPCGLNKAVDKTVILFAGSSTLTEAEIKLVIQQCLILREPVSLSDFSKSAIHTLVPQSSTTGSVRLGCNPAQTVIKTSFAIDIKMPPTP